MKNIRGLEPYVLVMDSIVSNQWVATMSQMLLAASPELYYHSINVALITAHMALFGNCHMLSEQGISIHSLVLGAFLHDIGYIGKGSSSACGKQPQNMSYIEQLAFHEHIQTGLEQIRKHTDDPVILDIVSMHHEYLNGSGYPNRLAGAELPPHVRLVSIANALASYIENFEHNCADGDHTPRVLSELLEHLDNEAVSGKYDIELLHSFFDGIMNYYSSLRPLHLGLHDYCIRKMNTE